MPTSRWRFQPQRKISTRMWNSKLWEPRSSLNIFFNPWRWCQSNSDSYSFQAFIKCEKRSLWVQSIIFLFPYCSITVCTFYFSPLCSRCLLLIYHSVLFPPISLLTARRWAKEDSKAKVICKFHSRFEHQIRVHLRACVFHCMITSLADSLQ